MQMTEPASSAAGAVAGWKLAGGAAGFAAGGAGLAALVVMCMMTPRSAKEWTVGLVSTVVGSICGGAAVVQHFGLHAWMDSYVGLAGVLGLVFACGLPAWAVVRWLFTYLERRKDRDFVEIASEVRKQLKDAAP